MTNIGHNSLEEEQPDIMQAIMAMSKDKEFDAEKMAVLVGMKNDHEDREAKRAFNRALVEFKKHPPRIIKNKQGHNNSYASIDSVCRQLDQPLYELGLSFRWRIATSGKDVTVTCILSHEDGYSEESCMTQQGDTSGKKNDIQGMGSTVTYLKRYTLLASLGLAEQGEDTDGITEATKQVIDDSQIEMLEKLIEEKSVELPKFCKAFKIGSLAEMSNAQFGLAIKQLNAKKVV